MTSTSLPLGLLFGFFYYGFLVNLTRLLLMWRCWIACLRGGLVLFFHFLIDGSDLIICRDNFFLRFTLGFVFSFCLISFLIFRIRHRFLHVLDVDGPALLGFKLLAFFKALNYEAKGRELAGAIAYYLGARDAKSSFEVD